MNPVCISGRLRLILDRRHGITLTALAILVQFVVAGACQFLVAGIGRSDPVGFVVGRVRDGRYAVGASVGLGVWAPAD